VPQRETHSKGPPVHSIFSRKSSHKYRARTSSPVWASTFAYLMRWPVLRLIWLKLIFSESEVAGYKATGRVTRERRKKPFQLARGAMWGYSKRNRTLGFKTILPQWFRHSMGCSSGGAPKPSGLPVCSRCVFLSRTMGLDAIRNEIEHMRRQILRQRKEIRDLQRAGIPTKSAEELLTLMLAKVDGLCGERDRLIGE
jgi:hypothetical protein